MSDPVKPEDGKARKKWWNKALWALGAIALIIAIIAIYKLVNRNPSTTTTTTSTQPVVVTAPPTGPGGPPPPQPATPPPATNPCNCNPTQDVYAAYWAGDTVKLLKNGVLYSNTIACGKGKAKVKADDGSYMTIYDSYGDIPNRLLHQ